MSLRRNVIPAPSGQREDALKRMFHEKAAFAGPVGTLQDIGAVKTDGTLMYSIRGTNIQNAWMADLAQILYHAAYHYQIHRIVQTVELMTGEKGDEGSKPTGITIDVIHVGPLSEWNHPVSAEYDIYDNGVFKEQFKYDTRRNCAEYIIDYCANKRPDGKKIAEVYSSTHWQWNKVSNA